MLRERRVGVPPLLVVAVVVAVTVGVCQAHFGDVRVYRAGGLAVFGGELYGIRVGDLGFTYPPFAAVVLAPLAHLPVPAMFATLTVASALAAGVVLRRSVSPWTSSTAVWAIPLALAQPLVATVAWGQVNLVLAALVLHDLLVRRSGVLVGVAAAIKLTPAIFVLYLLLCGRMREARNAVLAFATAAAVGAIAAPAASWRYWTHEAFAGSGVGGFDHTANQSVRGLAERILGHGAGVTAWLVLAGPLVVLGLGLARRVAGDGQQVLAAGIVGVTACLVSPVSWTHHWVWCIPCLAALALPARAALGVVFVNPVPLGHVLGFGYPVVAVAALCAGWWRTGPSRDRSSRRCRSHADRRRGSPSSATSCVARTSRA